MLLVLQTEWQQDTASQMWTVPRVRAAYITASTAYTLEPSHSLCLSVVLGVSHNISTCWWDLTFSAIQTQTWSSSFSHSRQSQASCPYFLSIFLHSDTRFTSSPHCTFKEWHGIVSDGNGEDRNVRGQMAESVNARCEVISVYRPCGRAANAPASPGRQRASIDGVKWTSPWGGSGV